jgi:hypothetical protein
VAGLFGSMVVVGVCISISGLRPSAALIGGSLFVWSFAMPLMGTSSAAIWMPKTPQALMGRVAAVRRMAFMSMMPLAVLIAGPVADRVFEPLLAPGGPLAGSVGGVLGVGKGRGIGLMFVLLGVLVLLTAAAAWLSPAIRNVERDVPDAPHPDAQEPARATSGAGSAGELAAAD